MHRGKRVDRPRPQARRRRRDVPAPHRAAPTPCSRCSDPASPSDSASAPTSCLARNPRLVYGRLTGWGQDGPYAAAAGHDIDYIALAGALEPLGRAGPAADAADQRARRLRGRRDAARVRDRGGGVRTRAHRAGPGDRRGDGRRRRADADAVLRRARASGFWGERGHEPARHRRAVLRRLRDGRRRVDRGRRDRAAVLRRAPRGARARRRGAPRPRRPGELAGAQASGSPTVVRTRTRDEWVARSPTAPTRASPRCSTPIEAPAHPHNRGRAATFLELRGVPQPAPAPRFSRTPARRRPRRRSTRASRPRPRSPASGSTPPTSTKLPRRRRPRLICRATTPQGEHDMPIPEQRNLEEARGILAEWLARAAARRDRRRGRPDRRPGCDRLLERDAALRRDVDADGGERRTEPLVVRVKPTRAHRLPRVRLRDPVPGARDARHGAPTCRCPTMRWFEADDTLARRAVLRDGPRRRPRARRQPAVHRRGLAARGGDTRAAAHARRERARGDGDGPRRRLARARLRLPRQAAVRAARLRAAAALLRGVVRVGRRGRARARSSAAALDWVARPRARPTDPEITVCWGDARINNQLFGADYHVAAVVDWEMVTLADPMMDLGWWLFLDRFFHEGTGARRAWRASRPARRWSPTTSR